MQLVATGHQQGIRVRLVQVSEVLPFALVPVGLPSRSIWHTVGASFDNAKNPFAKRFLDRWRMFDTCVLQCVMQETSYRLVFIPSKFHDQCGHGHEVADIGDGCSFTELSGVETGG